MHDQNVKKQLFLLLEVFNKFKKRQEFIAGSTNYHGENNVQDETGEDMDVANTTYQEIGIDSQNIAEN